MLGFTETYRDTSGTLATDNSAAGARLPERLVLAVDPLQA